MKSNLHGLKNRPYLRPHIRAAFEPWALLEQDMKVCELYPNAQTEVRVFLSWLMDEHAGELSDLAWLLAHDYVTNAQIIDWERSKVAA